MISIACSRFFLILILNRNIYIYIFYTECPKMIGILDLFQKMTFFLKTFFFFFFEKKFQTKVVGKKIYLLILLILDSVAKVRIRSCGIFY